MDCRSFAGGILGNEIVRVSCEDGSLPWLKEAYNVLMPVLHSRNDVSSRSVP